MTQFYKRLNEHDKDLCTAERNKSRFNAYLNCDNPSITVYKVWRTNSYKRLQEKLTPIQIKLICILILQRVTSVRFSRLNKLFLQFHFQMRRIENDKFCRRVKGRKEGNKRMWLPTIIKMTVRISRNKETFLSLVKNGSFIRQIHF